MASSSGDTMGWSREPLFPSATLFKTWSDNNSRLASCSWFTLCALRYDARWMGVPCFFLAGVSPVVSLGAEMHLFCDNPSNLPKRLAIGASSAWTGDNGGACANFISSWVTSWGTILGKWGGGVRLAMVDYFFFGMSPHFFVSEVEPGAGKIRSDLKKANASWSL